MKVVTLVERFICFAEVKRLWVPRRLQCAKMHLRDFAEHTIRGDALQGREPTHYYKERFPERSIGRLTLEQFERADLADYLWELSHRTVRGGRPISISTVSEYRKDIISMFGWGHDVEFVSDATLAAVQRVKLPQCKSTGASPRQKVAAIPDKVMDDLIAYCENKTRNWQPRDGKEMRVKVAWRRFTLATIIFRHTGMRRGEGVEISPLDIRFDRDTDPDFTTPIYSPGQHKTADHGFERKVPLNSIVQAAVMELQELNEAEARGQATFAWVPLFPNWKDGDSYYRFFKKALKEAKLGDWTVNQIRHRVATNAARINVEGARVLLGHRDVRTTMNYLDDEIGTAVDIVGQLERQSEAQA